MPSALEYFRIRRRFKKPLRTAAGVFTERESIVIKTADGDGEIAPWPGFGCETLDEAEAFLKNFRDENKTPVPANLPCTRAAFSMTKRKTPAAALRFAGFLPRGNDDVPAMLAEKRAKGFSTFKLKIAGGDTARVSEILAHLRAGEKLRLDANGTLDSLAPWLPFFENEFFEFLEQPFSPARMAAERFSPEIEAKLALDESISAARALPEDRLGFLVIKPALLGDWDAFRRQRRKVFAPEKIIYSSVFETEVGRAAALSLAGEDPFAGANAHGFDTEDYFEELPREGHASCRQHGSGASGKDVGRGAQAACPPRDMFFQKLPVFCVNPHWGETERAEADEIIKNTPAENGEIFIPTGGTGGKVKFVPHTPATLEAAARAQCEILAGGAPVFSLSTLPLWHVSGIMPVFRARVSGGRVQPCDGKFLTDAPLPALPAEAVKFFKTVSLVPTQLRRILERPDCAGATWLRQFDCVLLGGAATPADLLARCRREQIRVGIGYGMTETAAFVALHAPADFLAGKPVAGKILSHARIRILDASGNALPANAAGQIEIFAESVPLPERKILTQDEGFIDDAGLLHLLGRIDRFINTGGEKVDPRRVEEVLVSLPGVRAALVVGETDPEWGARVAAILETENGGSISIEDAASLVRERLARHCVPKRFVFVGRLPFNEKGKLDSAELARILAE